MNLERIAVILVLYDCQMQESATLNSLNQACKRAGKKLVVCVYDNSPNSQEMASFSHLNILDYHHDYANSGVSLAYNFFAEQQKKNFDWFLLLDQDTHFPKNYVEELLKSDIPKNIQLVLPKLYQKGQIISPHKFILGYSFSEKKYASEQNPIKNRSALNSGMLISNAIFQKSGGYAEDVPLYFSDQVFIHQLKNVGLNQFYLLDVNCSHSMSSNDEADLENFKKRFYLHVKGARAARKHFNFPTQIGLRLVVFARALKLSMKHRNGFFLKTLFKK